MIFFIKFLKILKYFYVQSQIIYFVLAKWKLLKIILEQNKKKY